MVDIPVRREPERQPRRPLVGIPASVRELEHGLLFHGTGQQYHDAAVAFSDVAAVTVPCLPGPENAAAVLDHLDGILLTGSFSHVHPETYGDTPRVESGFYDPARDGTTLPLIRRAVERGVPVFGICRGMQEFNVAFGGTLHQVLHTVPGRDDHRSDERLPLADQFESVHEMRIEPGGVLAGLWPDERVRINSSHVQGVDRLGAGLRVEGTCDDGTIEALSVEGAAAFALAVQFHPEWGTGEVPFYQRLFAAFGDAARDFAARRRAGEGAAR